MRLYLLLLLIPVIGIGIYGHQYILSTLIHEAIQNNLDQVGVYAETLDILLGQMHDDVLYLGQRVQGSRRTINERIDPSDELNGFAASHPSYQVIAWLDDNGRELGGYISETLSGWAATEAFSSITDQAPNTIRFITLTPENDPQSGLLVVAARLEQGILLIEVNTAYLLQGLTNNQSGDEWALLVQPGLFLTHVQAAHYFADESDLFKSTSGYITVGDRYNLYHRAGPGSGWVLVNSLPREAMNPNLSGYYTIFFFLLIGGLISVVGLALFAIARMIDPVYQLERMVDQLRNGAARPSLPERVPNDEFGKLMLAFDQMAAELDQKRQTERALIEQLIRAQEEERKLIAFDLHDGLIQQLVGARFYLGQYRNHADQPGEKQSSAARSYDVLTEAIAEGRRIIQGLHPTVLEDLGLEAALKELVKDISQTANWEISVDIEALDPQPDRATSVTLYRITQEALNNAFKHARANTVTVKLATDNDHLCLRVTDDGCGFEPGHVLNNGGQNWGVKTMRERATMLRGICEITSSPNHGTKIQVTIPYEQERMPA